MQVVNTSFVCVQNTIHKAKRDRLYNVIICLSDGIVLDFFLTSRYIKINHIEFTMWEQAELKKDCSSQYHL